MTSHARFDVLIFAFLFNVVVGVLSDSTFQLLPPPDVKTSARVYYLPYSSTEMSSEDLLCAMYGFCSDEQPCHEKFCVSGMQTFYHISIEADITKVNGSADMCMRHPGTHSRYVCAPVNSDNTSTSFSITATNAHLGINIVMTWLQRGRGKTAKILSETQEYRFCLFPNDIPVSACNPKPPDHLSGFLTSLPVFNFMSPSLLSSPPPGVQIHRFAKYDAGINTTLTPQGRTMQTFDATFVLNTSLPSTFLVREAWDGNRYSNNYYGSMVEISFGSVVGEFIFDAKGRYMFDGCERDYRWLPQPLGDRPLKSLKRKVHYRKLVIIRSMFSDSYFHFIVEAAPRILYVLERLRKNDTINLLVDPMRYGNRQPHLELLVDILGIPRSQIVTYDKAVVYSSDTLFVPAGTPCNNPPPGLFRDFSATVRRSFKELHLTKEDYCSVDDRNMCHGEYVVMLVRTKESMNNRATWSAETMKKNLEAKLPIGTLVLPFYGNETMKETARIFGGAAAVVGMTGAGFSNLIFSRPRTVMVMAINRSIFLESHAYDPDLLDKPQMIDTLGSNPFPASVHIGTALKLGMVAKCVIVENITQFPMNEFINALRTGLLERKMHNVTVGLER